MLNKTVEAKELNLKGIVYDYNEKFVWIENEVDLYKIAIEKVTEVETVETYENDLEKYLYENEVKFDGITDGDNVSYMINGGTYLVDVYLDLENSIFSLETKHNGFEKEEGQDEWANRKSYKKLSTLINNVEKWINK